MNFARLFFFALTLGVLAQSSQSATETSRPNAIAEVRNSLNVLLKQTEEQKEFIEKAKSEYLVHKDKLPPSRQKLLSGWIDLLLLDVKNATTFAGNQAMGIQILEAYATRIGILHKKLNTSPQPSAAVRAEIEKKLADLKKRAAAEEADLIEQNKGSKEASIEFIKYRERWNELFPLKTVRFENRTPHSTRWAFLRYDDYQEDWVTEAWYNMDAGESAKVSYLSSLDTFYYHSGLSASVSEAFDPQALQKLFPKVMHNTWGNELDRTVGGQTVSMSKRSFDSPLAISCDCNTLSFTNNSKREVKVYARYVNLSNTWTSSGWYTFAPGERAYLTDGKGNRRQARDGTSTYFYALASDGKLEWKGEHEIRIDGKLYGFRKLSQFDWSVGE